MKQKQFSIEERENLFKFFNSRFKYIYNNNKSKYIKNSKSYNCSISATENFISRFVSISVKTPFIINKTQENKKQDSILLESCQN